MDPLDWNDLINDPNTILVDTRNDYEYDIGSLKMPLTQIQKHFVSFPEYVKKILTEIKK